MKITIFLILTLISRAAFATTYCVAVAKFDINPYREIIDGKDMTYLPALFLSYISTEASDIGAIKAYDFSPDGKIFRAKINSEAKWDDGSALLPEELVYNFIKVLENRPLGQRIKIKGQKKISKIEDIKSIEGIKILDSQTFELTFESSIQNITGVLREALSTGSRHNRFWIVSSQGTKTKYFSRYKILDQSDHKITIDIKGQKIKFVTKDYCKNADIAVYPEFLQANLSDYTSESSPIQAAATIILNTNKPKDYRIKIANSIKEAFSKTDPAMGFVSANSFYIKGEPGYSGRNLWSSLEPLGFAQSPAKVFCEISVYKDFLAKKFPSWIYLNTESKDISSSDAQVLASSIFGGRHIIFQDLLKWKYVEGFLAKAPETLKILTKIEKLSASTIPPDSKVLLELENIAFNEASILPLGRRTLQVFTNKKSKIYADWNSGGEVIFKVRGESK